MPQGHRVRSSSVHAAVAPPNVLLASSMRTVVRAPTAQGIQAIATYTSWKKLFVVGRFVHYYLPQQQQKSFLDFLICCTSMLFPTALPETERGSYFIYLYLPLNRSKIFPGGFFFLLLWMKVLWQVASKEMKTEYKHRAAEQYCGLPEAGKHSEFGCFSKGEEFFFCFLFPLRER